MKIDEFAAMLRDHEPPVHKERAHSKFSASGADRWFACSGSVELSEGIESKSSVYAEEGTKAHELLEKVMIYILAGHTKHLGSVLGHHPRAMIDHVLAASGFILKLGEQLKAQVMVETRVHLDFIHPEMFGTFDGAVVDHFGTLHVFDFKYGSGHAVSPKENLQMIFYGIGLAHKYDWNFKNVRLWIIQPRIRGYDGPTFWDISIQELKRYVGIFKEAVRRVEERPTYFEGSHCHWCRAKSKCPLKQEAKIKEAQIIFRGSVEGIESSGQGQNQTFPKKEGSQKSKTESSVEKSEADWRKEARTRKR